MTARERDVIEDSAGYDAARDFEQSLLDAYRAIRERVAAGGPPWVRNVRKSVSADRGAQISLATDEGDVP